VGQLAEAADVEGPQAHGAARDWLIRVGIEKREIIVDLERLHPGGIAVGERRPEARGTELVQVAIDRLRSTHELAIRREQFSIVLQPVHPDFKTTAPQLREEVAVDGIPFRDKIERGPEAVGGIELGKVGDPVLTGSALHVVGQDERIPMAVWPEVSEWQSPLPALAQQRTGHLPLKL